LTLFYLSFEDIPITDIQLDGITSVPFTRINSAVIVPVIFAQAILFFMKITYAGNSANCSYKIHSAAQE